MINEKQIHYLLTLEEEKNITAAARKLYISQPALSRLVLDLERSLGTALFIRDHGNLHLTQAGEIYLQSCKEALAISKSAVKRISDLNDSKSGKVSLGVTSFTGETLLPRIFQRFEQQFPGVELTVLEERMVMLQEMVKSGKADLAFVYQNQDPDLSYQKILENTIYLQVPPFFLEGKEGWKPGYENPSLEPEELSGQPMILLKKTRGMREAADIFLRQFQLTPGKVIETESMHLAQELVRFNKGFTFVPGLALSHPANNGSTSFYCKIRNYPMKRSLYCCYRKHGYLTEAERFLIQVAAEYNIGDLDFKY